MAKETNILQGQVAIVTGGGRGIGQAIAQALAAAGAKVAVAARSADQLARTVEQIEQFNAHALAVPVDVTDLDKVRQMVAQVEEELGPVDLLVCSAGFGGRPGPVRETDPEAWWQVMAVNLQGPFLCAQAVLPTMRSRGRGRIINVSSGTSLDPWINVSAYAVSKAALNRFTENLALETADDNIAVFAIDPGMVRTAMVEELLTPEWKKWDNLAVHLLEEGYDVPPDRAAELTLALASGKADVLSGCYISIHDDLEEMVAQARRIQDEELYLLRMKRL